MRDRKLATQDIYPLSQTPLRYLLSDRIDLLKLDIEGSEAEVFASSSGWIDRVDAICL